MEFELLTARIKNLCEMGQLILNKMADIFGDDNFQSIFNRNVCCDLNFVPEGPIDNKWALVQLLAWQWTDASHYMRK